MPQTLDLLRRSLAITPSSFNPETRTFSAVISTGADVERVDQRGPFIERLDLTGIDPATLAGIPVLDGHRQGGSEHVVGVVAAVRREGSALIADIQLTSAADVAPVVTRVAEGVLRGVSIGYGLADVRETKEADVFGEAARKIGEAAAATEAKALIRLLQLNNGAGPTMEDGSPLFDLEAHNNTNDASTPRTGGPVDHELVAYARKALRSQKGIDGIEPVAVTPRYLVVGPENETYGEKLLATLAATKVEDQNVFSGRLELLVEPRITDASWYLFGDPATSPVLERAYLASAQGPQIQAREGWERLGREYRVILDLGVGAVDWRGAFRNDGIYVSGE